MKVTKPSEMDQDNILLEEAVRLFEEQLKTKDKNDGCYYIEIQSPLSQDICNEIQEMYSNAGWDNVTCLRTNVKLFGYTVLTLYKP